MLTNDKAPAAAEPDPLAHSDRVNRADLKEAMDRIRDRVSTQADCFENAMAIVESVIAALCTPEGLDATQCAALSNVLSLADDYISVAYSRYLLEDGRGKGRVVSG